MKVNGIQVGGAKTALVVLPRAEGDIPFRFKAVLDTREFDDVHPRPKPPRKWVVGQGNIDDFNDKAFIERFNNWRELRGAWLFLKSLEDSEIEWDSVKKEDPSTWKLWRKELEDASFNAGEIAALESGFLECNTVTDSMLKEARERFLLAVAVEQLPET